MPTGVFPRFGLGLSERGWGARARAQHEGALGCGDVAVCISYFYAEFRIDDECDMETKKMILSRIMRSIKVSRDYEIEIEMTVDCEQLGLDI